MTNMLDWATDHSENEAYMVALDQAMKLWMAYNPEGDPTSPAVPEYYLAGKMSGLPGFGFPLFDRAAADLRGRGYIVLSPAEMDDPNEREHALASPDGVQSRTTLPRAHFLKRDFLIVIEVDGVVVLPNWLDSTGALAETLIAFSLDKPVLAYPDLRPLAWSDHPYSAAWSDVARRDLRTA